MSLAEKIGALMQRPGQDVVPKDDVPWWMKYAGRGLGTVGGMVAILLGVWSCIGIMFGDVRCLVSGMWQMVAGAVAIMIEAPCCCLFIDFVQNISDWMEKRPYWNRAAMYCLIALPAVFLCHELQIIFGSGLIFTTGVIYGLMSLGRKRLYAHHQEGVAGQHPLHSAHILPPDSPASQQLQQDRNCRQ